MPTYEYACKACGEHLEVVQSFKDNALTECPACGGPLRKVFGNIGVAFKGSGFYKTDSRSESSGGAQKASEPKQSEGAIAKSEGSKSDGSKSDGSKSDGSSSKSEGSGSKSEGSKSEGSKAAPASNGPSKSSGGPSKVAAAS